MFKRFILASLFCLSVQAHATDTLEIAIKNSEVEATAEFLNTTTISKNELLQFINLAQEIINQRKSAWEIYALNARTNPVATKKELAYLENFRMKVKIGTIIGITTPLLFFLLDYCFSGKVSSGLFKTSITISAFVALFGNGCFDIIDNKAESVKKVMELKQEYDNAIKVKNLLMKSYAS